MVGIERDKLEWNAVTAPGANVVAGPIAVVEIHFGEHVLSKAVYVQALFKLFVLSVVFACKVSFCNTVYHLGKLFGRSSVGAASCPAVLAIGTFTAVLDHVDGLGIDSVVCFDETTVKTFAQVVNAEVFAVVEYNYLAAALVIDLGPFKERCHHGVADIVRPESVAVVA